jgi:hypothetical protein
MSHLPNPTAYDGKLSVNYILLRSNFSTGPLFKMDEYLNMLGKAAIPPPSSSRIRSRSPPPRSESNPSVL